MGLVSDETWVKSRNPCLAYFSYAFRKNTAGDYPKAAPQSPASPKNRPFQTRPAAMTSTAASEIDEPAPPRERRQRVQAAETCLAVLKALATLGGRASLTAIAGAVEESPAKVHRYLASLMAEGLVEQDRK